MITEPKKNGNLFSKGLFGVGSVSTMLMRCVAGVVCGIVLMSAAEANAVLLEFSPFNDGGTYDMAGLVVYADVTAGNDGEVRFAFYNDSSIVSSIEGIYFEAGALADDDEDDNDNGYDGGILNGIAGFEFGDGTLFDDNPHPGNLPSWSVLSPDFDAAFGADSAAPTSHNGIEAGEQMTIIVGLDDDATFEDVIGQLGDGSLRIGLHIISLPCGESISAVSTGIVPEPATIAILGVGGMFVVLRKKKSL
jgi:hypothetical protein